jgi:MFS family permease
MAGTTLERPAISPAAAPAVGWMQATFGALSNRHYRVLWAGTVLSMLGFMISSLAQSVVAYDITGNNRAVGTVMFGQGIAMLLLNPVGGAVADRVSKRLMITLCQSIIALSMLAVAVLIIVDAINVFFLAASAFVMGTMFSFLGPTRTAYLGDIVGAERMGNAIALQQVGMNATRVVGPFIAGGLLAWSAVGPAGTYIFLTIVFATVVATMFQLPESGARPGDGSGVLAGIRQGLRHVVENPRLLPVVAGFILVTVLGFPYFVILPGFTKDVLGAGTVGLGVLSGVAAVGGLSVSLLVASQADTHRARFLLTLSAALLGLGLFLTGLAPTFPVALVTMFIVGAGGSAYQTLNNAIALQESRAEYFGRVMSLMMLAWSFNGLISLPLGFLADEIGERAVFMTMGGGVGAATLVLALWTARLEAGAGRAGEATAAL